MTLVRSVHTIGSIEPSVGGPARSVTSLARALEGLGARTTLVTAHPPGDDLPFAVPSDLRATAAGPGRRARFRATFADAVGEGRPVVAHDHGIWLPTNHAVAAWTRRHGVPRVVSPRGMLDPWALRWHGARKRVAWALYQRRDLRRADLLHATSEAEADGFRARGLNTPVVVVPNGVDVSVDAAPLPGSDAGPRVLLFLSRVHPKKGLLHLAEAWARLEAPGWELWIAGPDELDHEAEVRAALERHARATSSPVRFLGPVTDAKRDELLARCSAFVLPTLSENFGQVVAEALAAARPVLTTKAAPWRGLVDHGAGWWVETGTDALHAALTDLVAAPQERLAAMGVAGRAWIQRDLAWETVAHRMAAAYAWLGGGPQPDDVTA